MPPYVISALVTIIAALLGAWAGSAISRKASAEILAKEQFFIAASKFKASIIYELTGFFPFVLHWDEKQFHRFRNSIARVNSYAAEFRYFVASKTGFDTAVKEYTEYCAKIKYSDIVGWDMYPRTRQQLGDVTLDPRKEFERIVHNLLSFAEEK